MKIKLQRVKQRNPFVRLLAQRQGAGAHKNRKRESKNKHNEQ